MLSSFYPVVAGRTSDAISRNRSLFQVQTGRNSIQRLEEQISTGRRIRSASEDPTAAIRVLGIQRDLEYRDQAVRNLDSSQTYLNVTESTLSNVQNVMTEIRGLGVEVAGNLSSDEERSGWISQINASIERLTAAANAKHLDRYIFAGGTVGNETVASKNGLVQWQGNDTSLLTIANDGEFVAHNVTGQKAFGLVSEGVTSKANLSPNATLSTRLSDLNQGRGVSPGAIQFSDGFDRVSIDLAGSETIEDVLQRINGSVTLSGRPVNVSLVNGALSVDFIGGHSGSISISESKTGSTGSDLGLVSSSPVQSVPFTGTPLRPILRPSTLLANLNGGTGFGPTDSIQISQNGKTYNVPIGSATTIEEFTNNINTSGAHVTADITPDGSSLRIRSIESGSNFSIGEGSGGLADRLGLRTFSADTRLDQLNFGRGTTLASGPDLTIVRNDGSELSIDLDGAITVQNVLDRINNHSDNQNPATQVFASLNSTGNGISLASSVYVPDPLGPPLTTTPGPIRVRNAGGSQAGWDLGLVKTGTTVTEAVENAGTYSLVGNDPNPQEVKGVFNSLVRLREAIERKDSYGVERAVALVDEDLQRLSLTRGSLGVQQQRIDNLIDLHEQTKIELKADESKNLDADLAQTITDLTAQQSSYEASLKLLSNSSQLTLFNYL